MKKEYSQAHFSSLNYPFTAIVGQEDMKLALILNLINPKIHGVLIRGEKGTAKSTAVRSLKALAGGIPAIDGEERSMNVVELPLGATEDRVVGTIDIEEVIQHGKRAIQYGILKEADGNILYVDEVNLLEDNLVDVILDAAAMGVNTIEREGISESHYSRFVLVGSMNPEEGDLRPQLIDRFGLVVDVLGEKNMETRVEIMNRRLKFENNPSAFIQEYEMEEEKLRDRILRARKKLLTIEISEQILENVAKLSIELGVDGHRGDITVLKTAQALAAWKDKEMVEEEEIVKAALLALPHRRKRNPFDEEVFSETQIRDILKVIMP